MSKSYYARFPLGKYVLPMLLWMSVWHPIAAQIKIGDNPVQLHPSAVLELESSRQGFLPPRMSTLQRDSISLPATGLVLYNTTTEQLEVNAGTPESPRWVSGAMRPGQEVGSLLYWDGSNWVQLNAGLPGQSLALSAQGIPFWNGPALPGVQTLTSAQTGQTTAWATGVVADNGGATVTARGFLLGLDSVPDLSTRRPSGSGNGEFQATFDGLTPNTTYYVRAYATNSAGTAYGHALSFQTLPTSVPTVNTSTPGSISPAGAVCGGAVTDGGGLSITARGVCWSTQPNPDIQSNRIDAGTGVGAFTATLSGLTPNTTYYVRAFASNSAGTAYGTVLSFTTQNLGLPILSTYEPSNINDKDAHCGGSITSNNGSPITARGVCWSLSPNPVITDSITRNGSGTGAFSSFLSGLNPSTTYYVRAWATNAIGTAYGEQRSFRTPAESPTLPIVRTLESTDIARYQATLRGTLVQPGTSAVSSRGFCWNTTGNPTISGGYTVTSATDTFSLVLNNLKGGQTYYVRAFAVNSSGVAYGEEQPFTTLTGVPLCTTTLSIENVYPTYAQVGGAVSDDGGFPILERGFVWATHATPEAGVDLSIQVLGATGALSARIQPLTPETTYYIRSYARNSQGIGYGNTVSFTTTSVVTNVVDIDGNQYPVVQIGSQIWMAENLRTTRYQDGTPIPFVLSGTDWKNATSGAWCYYNHDATLNIPYGKLYNGYVAGDARNVCPTGWKVPGRGDWEKLGSYSYRNFSGYYGDNSGSLRAKGIDFWNSDNCSSTNATGFNAVGAGLRYQNFQDFKEMSVLWHNDGYYGAAIRYCEINPYDIDYYYGRNNGYSIRCIKN